MYFRGCKCFSRRRKERFHFRRHFELLQRPNKWTRDFRWTRFSSRHKRWIRFWTQECFLDDFKKFNFRKLLKSQKTVKIQLLFTRFQKIVSTTFILELIWSKSSTKKRKKNLAFGGMPLIIVSFFLINK